MEPEEVWLARLRRDVDFIQIREPEVSTGQLARLVRSALVLGPRILVNDRIDVAIATGAAGVHLRDHSIAPSRVRAIAPAGVVITVAVHGVPVRGALDGADYVLAAPVFRPRSKQDTREPLGLEGLRTIVEASPIPVLALGGITEENAGECLRYGAVGVAAISLFGAESH